MARTKTFDEAEVLEKAQGIFWCKGYNGTSMQDLVDGLGISRSSLYDTYTDKRELFLIALKKYRDEQAQAMIEMINNSTSIIKAIEIVLKGLVEASIQDTTNKGCFIVNSTIEIAPHDKEVAAIVTENMQNIEEALYKAIRKGQEKGEIATKLPARALARFLFNTTAGLQVAAKAGAEKKVYDDVISVAMSVLKNNS
jgi:TetR/AcrR family transcriptional repressor of nem operon